MNQILAELLLLLDG